LAIAEVRNLQAQINPHFLYNTLDSIVWLSLAGRSDAVVETTRALTRLFRRSLSGGRDIIPLRDEIEHVESYLTIQRIRYADRLTFTVVCPDALKSISVLKLTLQPLVENSLYHGIKPLRRPAKSRWKRGSTKTTSSVRFAITESVWINPPSIASTRSSARHPAARMYPRISACETSIVEFSWSQASGTVLPLRAVRERERRFE
jgi:LytS/YehU family sensor histidine kinase